MDAESKGRKTNSESTAFVRKRRKSGLDEADFEILDLLQVDATRTNVKLSKALKNRGYQLGGNACGTRRDALIKEGYIEKIVAHVDHKKLGRSLTCFMSVNMENKEEEAVDRFLASAQNEPEILAIYSLTGGIDFLLKVRVAHMEDVTALSKRLRQGIAAVTTYTVGATIKDSNFIALSPTQRNRASQ